MTTYASFKPSVQFLEAGEKGQQFANAANTFKPLLSQEARQSIEGIDKVSQAFTATGRALEHFGFDEAEPEFPAFQQLQFAPHSMIEELPSVPALPLDDPEVQKIIESLGGPIEEVPESTVFQSVINELPPSFFVGGLPAPIEIEPGDPILQSVSQYIKQAGFDEAEADGLTGTGPTMPAFDGGESMDTLTPVEEFVLTPVATAANGLNGLLRGAFGYDVDEATPNIPEVGVDALA